MMVRMPERQLSLAMVLLLTAASPMWIFLCVTAPFSIGVGSNRFLSTPLILVSMALAIYWFLYPRRNSWGIAVLSASTITLALYALGSWMFWNSLGASMG
jgi:hypothetical protein